MRRPREFPHIDPPFKDSSSGPSRWRRVKTLLSPHDGVKVYYAVNQRLDDGLQLPKDFDVEKIPQALLSGLRGQQWCHVIQSLLELHDDRVVKLYGVWQDAEHIYVVREHCGMEVITDQGKREVRDVFTAVTCGGLPWKSEHQRQAATRSLETLASMHSKGLTHPDLRYEHIVLDSAGATKIDYSNFTPASYVSSGHFGTSEAKKRDVLKLGIALFALFFGQNAPLAIQPTSVQEASASNFLAHLMHPNANNRPSIEAALSHPWLASTLRGENADAPVNVPLVTAPNIAETDVESGTACSNAIVGSPLVSSWQDNQVNVALGGQ